MRFEVTILSTDVYVLEEIIDPKLIVNNVGDSRTCLSMTGTVFYSEDLVKKLLSFLFRRTGAVTEVYRDDKSYVLDLSSLRSDLIETNAIEGLYPKWLSDT